SHECETNKRAERAQPDPPRVNYEFRDVTQAELALTVFAIDEVDGHLLDHRTEGDCLVQQGNLEGVALHAQRGKIDLPQNRRADGAEAGGAIADSIEPGNIARHPVASSRVQLAPDAPLGRNASAFDVPASDNEVRGALEHSQQAWYVSRIVREVSV